MPPVFRLRTPVWQADVDAFGELRSATLLRFLQETATGASTAAGFDPAFYARQGALWLVRRTTLARQAPIRHGDELEATTWIADFRRVRSRREYEVRAGARVVARAATDWVYVDRATFRPRRIPAELQAGFQFDDAPALERPPFPDALPSPAALRLDRRVELDELDALHHVNNAVYVSWLEQAAQDADASIGWPLATALTAGGRFRAVAHDLEYLDGALYGDDVTVVVWPRLVAADSVERQALVVRAAGGRPLLRAISRYAWVDAASGAPRPLPDALRGALVAATGA